MERRDVYQNDLTEEDLPPPDQRDDVEQSRQLDPDTLGDDGEGEPETGER